MTVKCGSWLIRATVGGWLSGAELKAFKWDGDEKLEVSLTNNRSLAYEAAAQMSRTINPPKVLGSIFILIFAGPHWTYIWLGSLLPTPYFSLRFVPESTLAVRGVVLDNQEEFQTAYGASRRLSRPIISITTPPDSNWQMPLSLSLRTYLQPRKSIRLTPSYSSSRQLYGTLRKKWCCTALAWGCTSLLAC